jgi:DNA-binding NarL/FixJ family response regulator
MPIAGVTHDPKLPPVCEVSSPPLRVLLIDDGAHHIGLIHDELSRQGHLVVGVLETALLIHDCVLRLQPDVVIVDSESPSRGTLEHLGAVSASCPRPVAVSSEDAGHAPMQQALKAGVSAYVIAGLQPQRLAPVLQVAIGRFADGSLQAFLLAGDAAAQGWMLDLLQQGQPAASYGRALAALIRSMARGSTSSATRGGFAAGLAAWAAAQ